MQRSVETDVLVVGLGPGGASAAASAAAAGLRVVGAERKRRFGEPVQCAEFVPRPMGRYAKADGVRVQSIAGMKTFLPSGSAVATAFPGLMIDRAAFDRAIIQRARDNGARLWDGTRLAVLSAPHAMAVLEHGDGSTTEVRYRLLVAADGPSSTVAMALGLPKLKTVNTRQYTVPLLRDYEDTDIWVSDDYPGGYAWLFPKGAVANLGLGIDRRWQADLKAPLDTLHRQLLEQGLVGGEILARTGGLIPVGGLRPSLVTGNAVFVGDAAGLTHPITGAGIAAAVVSGERAGEAAADWLAGDAEALADYEEDVRDQFEETLRRAVARRQFLETCWGTPAARRDQIMRRGWIAFDEYFAEGNPREFTDGKPEVAGAAS